MKNKLSSEKLIELYQESSDKVGREKLYKEILKRYSAFIGSTVRTVSALGVDKDELKQEFMIVLLKCINKFNTASVIKFMTYLHEAIENKTYDMVKRKTREDDTFINMFDANVEDYMGDNALVENSEEDYVDLKVAISKYVKKDKDKKLLYMRVFDKKTFQEIADEEGVARQAIHQRFDRIINRIKEKVSSDNN